MTTAMRSLCDRWGLSTSDVARALHTTATVIRHWRNGGEPNADEVARADRLNDFLRRVHEAGVEEPAAWMSMPIVDGYTITRWNILNIDNAGRQGLLLHNATGVMPDGDLLDTFDRDWRRTYWTSFKTVEAADGGLSVVGKSYDDVRTQVPGVAR